MRDDRDPKLLEPKLLPDPENPPSPVIPEPELESPEPKVSPPVLKEELDPQLSQDKMAIGSAKMRRQAREENLLINK